MPTFNTEMAGVVHDLFVTEKMESVNIAEMVEAYAHTVGADKNMLRAKLLDLLNYRDTGHVPATFFDSVQGLLFGGEDLAATIDTEQVRKSLAEIVAILESKYNLVTFTVTHDFFRGGFRENPPTTPPECKKCLTATSANKTTGIYRARLHAHDPLTQAWAVRRVTRATGDMVRGVRDTNAVVDQGLLTADEARAVQGTKMAELEVTDADLRMIVGRDGRAEIEQANLG